MTMLCGCGHEKELHDHTDNCIAEGCSCYQFISDVQKWKEARERWDWENKEDERIWNEIYEQDEWFRKDNEESD